MKKMTIALFSMTAFLTACEQSSDKTQEVSEILIEEVTLPEDFVPERYLELNPDLKDADVDPVDHYTNHGVKEGRQYK